MLIKIKAYPDSRKEVVTKSPSGRLSIHVREPAEGNRANESILEIIRSMHPKARVKMVSGHHRPNKIVSVEER